VKINLQILARVIPSPVACFWRTAARDLLLASRCFILFAITIGLIALFSANTQAQEPVPLARGNVPGEPHHHLKIENEYVRVYYVEVPPHEATQLHQHDHDYIYVSLGSADVVNAVRDKPEVHLVLKDGETHFTRGGFAHVARNLADTPFRNVTIELLNPQGETRNFCMQVVPGGVTGGCQLIMVDPGKGYAEQPLFETDAIKLDLILLDARARDIEDTSKSRLLLVGLEKSKVEINLEDKSALALTEGEVVWLEDARHKTIFNRSKKVSSYLRISFRDSAAGTRP
jgi:hypothetical protein